MGVPGDRHPYRYPNSRRASRFSSGSFRFENSMSSYALASCVILSSRGRSIVWISLADRATSLALSRLHWSRESFFDGSNLLTRISDLAPLTARVYTLTRRSATISPPDVVAQ